MSQKKVLLATRPLVPPWDEASKNFGYFLAKKIDHQDIEMHVLTTPEKLADLGVHAVSHEIYATEARKDRAHFPFLQKIRLLLFLFTQSWRYDIVHYLFTPALLNSIIIRYFTPFRPKSIQTVATLREDRYPRRLLKRLFFADRLITYTDRTKQKLQALGFNNVTRIYPGIDLERHKPGEKNPELLKRFGFSKCHFIVVYPGEYVRLGATDMITNTFIDFFQKNRDTDIRFVFACRVKNDADARKKEEIIKRFIAADVIQYVSFSDTISDMPSLYNTSDVVIFPVNDLNGKFDVPLIIIEAYACGKPVILSDLEQFKEFSNERICVTIPKGSGDKLIESVAHLKDNLEVRESIGENARRFVKDHFDLKNTARQYEEIYETL